MVDNAAWISNQGGISDEVGYTDGGIVHPAFVAEAKFTVEVAVVAGVNDEGVVGLADGVDFVEHSAKGIVYTADCANVVAHKGVVAFIVLESVGAFEQGCGFAVARSA